MGRLRTVNGSVEMAAIDISGPSHSAAAIIHCADFKNTDPLDWHKVRYQSGETSETRPPILRREARRLGDELKFGECRRVTRTFEALRCNEFDNRGGPPLPVAHYHGCNPRHVAKDVEKQLVEDAWNKHDSAREALADEVTRQAFESMLVHRANVIHDAQTTQLTRRRTDEERATAKTAMQQMKEVQAAYREKLLFDQHKAHRLVTCNDVQLSKSARVSVRPHTSHFSSESHHRYGRDSSVRHGMQRMGVAGKDTRDPQDWKAYKNGDLKHAYGQGPQNSYRGY